MSGKVTCSCGHSWNKSDSSKKDMNVCHICGKDNTMKDGGWLDKYQVGGEASKYIQNVPKTFGKDVAKTDSTKVTKKLKPTNARLVTQEELDEQEAQARRDRISVANAVQPYMFNSPKNFAVASSAIGDKLRVSDYPNFFDDYVNPASMFGHFASGLGQVPLNVQEGNYGQAAMNVAAPVVAGAAETIISPLISKGLSAGKKAAKSAIDRNFTEVGKQLAQIEKEGLAKGLSPHEIKMQQMEQVGITSTQREGYVPGVSELLHKYVRPQAYHGYNNETKLAQIIQDAKRGGVKYSNEEIDAGLNYATQTSLDIVPLPREDAWRMYLGMPQKYGTFELAQTAPIQHSAYTPAQLNNLELFSLASPEAKEGIFSKFSDYNPYNLSTTSNGRLRSSKAIFDLLDNPVTTDRGHIIMGGFNKRLSKGGLEYNDVWDLEPTITPYNLLPKGELKVLLHENPLFFNKELSGGQTVISPKDIKIKVDKFIGKPFLSHGVDPSISSEIITNDLRGVVNKELNTVLGKLEAYNKDNTADLGVDDWDAPWTPSSMKLSKTQLEDNLKMLSGYPKFKEGGWLDKYNDGGPVQENYNDYSVSAPEGFQGEGYSNVGRNYSPAWGGQFQNGGELPNVTVKGKKKQPIYVTDKNDPRLRAYQDSLGLYNESKNTEAKLAKILANAYKRTGFDKSTITKALNEGKDIVLHPEKYVEKGSFGYIKKYNKKGLYYESFPGEEYLGTPESPATIKDLIKYNKEDIKERTPYLNSLDEDINGLTSRERIESAKIVNASLQKQYDIMKRTGYNPTYFIPNAERSPNLIFKKPTQPVIYQERTYQTETPELQDLAMGLPVNVSLPELQRQAGPNRITMGRPLFKGGPQTDYYTPIDESGNVVQSNDFRTSQYAMGGSIPGAVGFTYARTGSIPSNGKYAKKTKASAQDGTQIKTNIPVPIDEIKKANASAESFNKQYVQSPNYLSLLQKQGYSPEEIKRRQDSVLGMTNDDYTYTNFGPNYVYDDDETGKTKINYNQGGLGDWSNFGDIAAHEWGHVGVTRFGEDALKPAEQYMLTSRLNMKNVSSDEGAAEHDMAPQENRADLVELRKALQDRGIYDSFKGGKFKQKHLNKLRNFKGDQDEYWNRSMRLYKDKDIIKLMNTIASNNPQQGMPIAQNGKEMKYYQDGLDFRPKSISKNGSVIKDDMGQWAHPGEITEIGSNQITMQGVPYPVLGISDTGDTQMMYPDEEYEYDGESVTEYPMMKQGGHLIKLDQLTNFTNYNTKQPGGWLDKYQ